MLQPFATFSQYINPWKVTCKPTQQQLCTCVQVGRLKHLQSEHWEQDLSGLAGADGSSAPPWSETWMGISELWHSPVPPSTQIPSIYHSAKPVGQMDTCTTILKASTQPSSSYELHVWPRVVRHTTEVGGESAALPNKNPWTTCEMHKGPDCLTCRVLCQLLRQEQGVTYGR